MSLRAFCTASALLMAIGGLGEAHAEDRLDTIHDLRAAAMRASEPESYAAIRKLWAEWDQGDPSAVEEALIGLTQSTARPAPVRAYAGLLAAYARRRRGDLDGARSRVAALGYVSRWLVVGPFDNEGKGGLMRVFGPEAEIQEPVSISKAYEGKERAVRWRALPTMADYGWVDLGSVVRPAAQTCTYATTFVRDAKASGDKRVSIWLGTAGAFRLFWNGKEVLQDAKYRDLDADRASVRVTLLRGYNRLTLKVCGEESAPMFSLRLADERGAPDPSLEADPDPSHAAEAAAHRFKKGGPTDAPVTGGPLAAWEARAKRESAATLEGFARYLVATQSDDASEHRARDMAARAATLEPTISRLLLAGDLAEDRNQRLRWIEKAEKLVRPGTPVPDRIRVLLARANHLRGGVNWRDAIPFYERVRALEPDNTVATLAEYDLFSEAGLKETALRVLEEATAERPRSVSLLRALASAYHDLDRTEQAKRTEERYAAFRFDDTAYVTSRIEAAIAQRDRDGAARWIERLAHLSPDNLGAAHTAANAWLRLGDPARAVATYKRALDAAPDDTDTLRALATAHALAGHRDEQLRVLRRVVELMPQAKDVREYLAAAEPSKPRPDELYARPSREFLAQRAIPSRGERQRTLVDLQVTTVFPNGLASRFHQVVFQPLTDAAASESRQYAFGFEADSETVQLRGARVYRKTGEIEEASESGEGPADNPALAMYTSSRVFYVHLPRLFPGDVVELLYRVEDVAPRNAFADYFGEVVHMQGTERILSADYILVTPKSRTFHVSTARVPGLTRTVEETETARTYKFAARDVPGIAPEPGQPPLAELLGYVHVSTYKTWDDLGKWYWGFVRDQFVADDEVRRRAQEVTRGLTDERSKVKAVYSYVVQRTRYVALEFGVHGFKPYRCAQIFARGFGDCKDKATLIVTMLKELGIPATIVIVRTAHKGDFETLPASLAPFDHAIAYVPSLDWYLDGTAEYTGSGELPIMDRNALALQINEGSPKLVRLPDPGPDKTVVSRQLEASLGKDGGAEIDFRLDVTGAVAGSWRERYHAVATRRERLQEDLSTDYPGLDVTALDAEDLDDVEKPVALRGRGRLATWARKDGSHLSVAVTPKEHFVRDYAPLSQRKLDLRLGAQNTTLEDITLKLAPGMRIVSLPAQKEETSPFGSVSLAVEQKDNVVRVRTKTSLAVSRVRAADYPAFRAFCERVDRALGERLVVQP